MNCSEYCRNNNQSSRVIRKLTELLLSKTSEYNLLNEGHHDDHSNDCGEQICHFDPPENTNPELRKELVYNSQTRGGITKSEKTKMVLNMF